MIKKIVNLLKREASDKVAVLSRALKGDNVYCICCSGDFITFLPFGLVKRANALCPKCRSLERHRLHWHFMVNRTNLLGSDGKLKLLHVAPEFIFYNKFNSNPKFDYVPCAKFGEGYIDEYPANTLNVDITNIHFEDNSFDVIYCSHVLEHVPHDITAMKEFRRILKPGGWAMLQVPLDNNLAETYEDFSITDAAEREKAFGQYDHVRIYGRDYRNRLELAGFDVMQIAYTEEFSRDEIFKNGFQQGEDIYICIK